jgi:hypothetical protein
MWLINEIRIWRNNRRAIKKLVSGEWVLGSVIMAMTEQVEKEDGF